MCVTKIYILPNIAWKDQMLFLIKHSFFKDKDWHCNLVLSHAEFSKSIIPQLEFLNI